MVWVTAGRTDGRRQLVQSRRGMSSGAHAIRRPLDDLDRNVGRA